MLNRQLIRLLRTPFSRTFSNGDVMSSSSSPLELKNNASRSGLMTYNQGELEFRPYLVLKSQQNIEEYVISLVRNYFRTTYKNGVSTESLLAEHGLDSLDAVELAMQIEEDLGYDIATETLSNFHSVNHFVNYITQVENYKQTYQKDPLA